VKHIFTESNLIGAIEQSKDEVVGCILNMVFAVCAIFMAGCASDRDAAANRFISQGTAPVQGTEDSDDISYWNAIGSQGEPRIVIDLDDQRAYFYKGKHIVGVSVVSTGREGYDTPAGEFRITDKDRDHVSSLYGDYVDQSGQVVVENVESDKDPRPPGTTFRGAAMPYFLRIHGGIGMHAGYLPGYPASHGCIRLPEEMAIQFFKNAPVGTPVEIRRASAPDFGASAIGERYSNFPPIIDR
jgi:lipoprotein-anchoring transpeptidase ErfK/SrfK